MDNTLNSKPSDDISPERLAQSGAAVADLAHLVKNIIQVLSGCAEIIELSLATGQIDRIHQAWQLHQPGFWRLKKFQLDLIKFTKSYPLNPQPCDLKAIVAAAVKQMGPFFSRRNIQFSAKLADDIPSIVADGEKIRDAVINVLVTAVDNLLDLPGQISLESALSDAGDTVHIIVFDSGPRLDAEACAALFVPSERGRNMLGTGLEIPLAKQVAEAHRGRLEINPDSYSANSLILRIPLKS